MTKRDKQFTKLLNQKTLSSSEAVRLLQLDGWGEDKDNPTDGSHYHLEHPVKKGKITVPLGRKVLKKLTRDSILRAADLI
ncbi:MAG: type II toxin-antitoxin system HicA family toxin [Synergistaceae bacterium]|nr:type II toxin-antitoxin system HicA family toxin [Synergistaceae bacterium]MBR1417811.1 type II toxin-antitoxin system HicA family toxin [Synergistaceae bacterium]MBR1604252.1 type II toxin-antitoxin system HicA family toxin [Synergistaceae bacterium]